MTNITTLHPVSIHLDRYGFGSTRYFEASGSAFSLALTGEGYDAFKWLMKLPEGTLVNAEPEEHYCHYTWYLREEAAAVEFDRLFGGLDAQYRAKVQDRRAKIDKELGSTMQSTKERRRPSVWAYLFGGAQ